eukprot:7017721-Prymnesium_polylepis.1
MDLSSAHGVKVDAVVTYTPSSTAKTLFSLHHDTYVLEAMEGSVDASGEEAPLSHASSPAHLPLQRTADRRLPLQRTAPSDRLPLIVACPCSVPLPLIGCLCSSPAPAAYRPL